MGVLIFILILVVLPLVWPWIRRSIARYAAGKMEDRFRAMMGMPSRAEEKKAARQQAREEKREQREASSASSWRDRFARRGARRHPVDPSHEALRMMRIYAEDADYVEIREYSQTVIFAQDPDSNEIRFAIEEQLSEAEYQIIK